jgi:hypothetical protein
MPYKLIKVEGGWKVGLSDGSRMSNGRYYLSNKPLTKKMAQMQMQKVGKKEETHVMPDGTIMSGKKHKMSSKVVKSGY